MSHPINTTIPNHVMEAAQRLRRALEAMAALNHENADRLTGWCGKASTYFCSLYPELFDLAYGMFRFHGDLPHFWCMIKGTNLALDLTATQFKMSEKVFVCDITEARYSNGELFYRLISRDDWFGFMQYDEDSMHEIENINCVRWWASHHPQVDAFYQRECKQHKRLVARATKRPGQ